MRTREVLDRLRPGVMEFLTDEEIADLRRRLARDYVTAQRLREAVTKKLQETVYTRPAA